MFYMLLKYTAFAALPDGRHETSPVSTVPVEPLRWHHLCWRRFPRISQSGWSYCCELFWHSQMLGEHRNGKCVMGSNSCDNAGERDFNSKEILPSSIGLASSICCSIQECCPLTAARNWSTSLVLSVFPAPDSPLTEKREKQFLDFRCISSVNVNVKSRTEPLQRASSNQIKKTYSKHNKKKWHFCFGFLLLNGMTWVSDKWNAASLTWWYSTGLGCGGACWSSRYLRWQRRAGVVRPAYAHGTASPGRRCREEAPGKGWLPPAQSLCRSVHKTITEVQAWAAHFFGGHHINNSVNVFHGSFIFLLFVSKINKIVQHP